MPRNGYDHKRVLDDMCWLDDVSLIGVQNQGQQVIKFNIHIAGKTCTSRVIDSGYEPWSVGCAHDGNIYVTDTTNDLVHIYHKVGVSKVWKPYGMSNPRAITVNEERIYVSENDKIFVYNAKQEFLYKVSIVDAEHIIYIHVIYSQVIVVKGYSYAKKGVLIIFYMSSNTTSAIVDNRINRYSPVASTHTGHVLVATDSQRTAGYSTRGDFLYTVKFEGKVGINIPKAISVLPRAGTSSLLVVADAKGLIRIYDFKECGNNHALCN